MKITDKMIDDLADLSKLEFNAEERLGLKKDLENVIGMMDKLNELNTDGVEPLLHMTSEVNALRKDEIKGSITREAGLKNAPLKDEEFFKVPKVINK